MKLLVIDGNSILSRAFYGIRPLTTKSGLHTNGIYGFYNILNKLIEETAPDSAAVAFDLRAPTFRHKAFDGYKAGRKPMPEELAEQLPVLKKLLDLLGIPRLEAEGFEADDILGTEANACCQNGQQCVIATGDRDSLQLVGDCVTVFLASTKAGRPNTTVYDVPKIMETYGVSPLSLIEVKALMGDASDRIPGVPGVGEKTALSLISKYGTVDYIYQHLESLDIRDSLRKKLEDGRDSAFMSRDLAEIRKNAPVETDIEKLRIRKPDQRGLYGLLTELEFFSVIKKLELSPAPDSGEQAGTESGGQPAARTTLVFERDGAKLLSRLRENGEAFFAAETGQDGITSICFAGGGKIVAANPEKTGEYERFLKEFMTDRAIQKYTHDIKPVYTACLVAGYELAGESFDTMLAAYLLNPLAASYEPERLAAEYGLGQFEAPLPEGAAPQLEEMARTAYAVKPLYEKLSGDIKANGQEKLYFDVELPLARVLSDMEYTGFQVDADGIKNYGEGLKIRLDDIQGQIYGYTGYEFNINSTKQLGEALFVKLGLPPKKKTKTGYSTNAEVLEALRGIHPVIGLLLEYRQLAKLKSTYTDGLLKVIAPDGRIHSSFNQVETRTGRISSTEPNLQNIPVRSEAGRELRRYFVPRAGWSLVDADYSQIELRILAHVANDSAMIDAFNRGVDIHTLTASQVFHMPLDMVTPLMRSRAKAVNFGIVYGIGAFSLSQDIGVSVKEADSYIKGYLSTFSGVQKYMDDVIAQAHEKGYVETLLGRRRSLPELTSSNRNLRNFGERVARNTPIQGTAADIIKIAMIRVHDRLKKEGMNARLILQVHDELIVEAPAGERTKAEQILREEMEGAMALTVKLPADVHSGGSWYDSKG